MELAKSRSELMSENPGNAVRTASTLETVLQATARWRATWPLTGVPFTDPPASEELGQTVFTGRPVPLGSPAVTIGSPALYGFADDVTGKSWFRSLSRVR